MEVLWEIILGAIIICTLLSSLHVAVVGLGHPLKNPAARCVFHDGWNIALIILLPLTLGEFARREVSSLPWIAFSNAMVRHGIIDGIFGFVVVFIVDLWLLWIPAQSYIRNQVGLDKRTIVMARALNLAIGLLLLTPDNPIYQILISFGSSSTR